MSNPLLDAEGKYPGSYDLVGGIDGNAADVLDSASFSVTTVPEPSAFDFLLGVAAVTLVRMSRKARRRASDRSR